MATPQPYLRNVPGSHAQPADALTGEPLLPHTYRYTLSTDRLDNARWVRQGDAPETTACPTRLHTATVEQGGPYGGGLGGHCFARQFAVYLAQVKPLIIQQAEMARRYWWASAYGRRRVEARFIRRFGLDTGAARYRIALSLASGYRAYDDLMAETHHSASWLADQMRMAEDYAREPAVRAVRPIEPRRRS